MAKIKLSSLISDISGKVGGSIFQSSLSGHTVRNLNYPTNRKTDPQENIRNISIRLQKAWYDITPSQRTYWRKYAWMRKEPQINNPHLYLNGHQLFLKINHYRLLYRHPILVHPWMISTEFTRIDISLHLFVNKLLINESRERINDQEFLAIFLTFPKRITVNNPGSTYRAIIGDFLNPITNFINNEYYNIFSYNPVKGDTLFFKFTNISKKTGLMFPFWHKKVTLT